MEVLSLMIGGLKFKGTYIISTCIDIHDPRVCALQINLWIPCGIQSIPMHLLVEKNFIFTNSKHIHMHD